jgi:hypothetical protein
MHSLPPRKRPVAGRVGVALLLVILVGCGEVSQSRRWLGPELLESYEGPAVSPALVVDARGDALVLWQQGYGAEPGLWSNTLVSGRWRGSEPVQRGEGVGSSPRIVSNESGVTFALWENTDLAVGWRRLRAARRLPGGSWEVPTAVDADEGRGDVNWGQVSVDREGRAVAVWANFGRVLSNRFDPGTGWGSPEILSRDASALAPLLRMDSAGNALVLWYAYPAWVARRFEPGRGWGREERLPGIELCCPVVAMSPRGEAVVLWHRVGSTDARGSFVYSGIWANRFVRESGWTPLVPLAEEERLNCRSDASVDAAENILAVWSCRIDPLEFHWGTWYSRLPAGGGWEAARRLTSLGDSAEFNALEGDGAGGAIALWVEGSREPSRALIIRALRYAAGEGWGPPQYVGGPGDLSPLYAAMSPRGDGIAVWVDGPFGPGTQRIRAARYAAGIWHPPEEVGGPGDVDGFRMAMTPGGDGVAVWQQGIGGSMWSVWASRFALPQN